MDKDDKPKEPEQEPEPIQWPENDKINENEGKPSDVETRKEN